MRTNKIFYLWWLLQKRMLKKPIFLILLILIPVLCFSYSTAAEGEGSVLTVALAQEGADPLAEAVIRDLAGSSRLIRFRVCARPEEAEQLVRQGKADAAWIFPEELEQKMARFAADPRSANAFVRVLERESNVLMLLTREKLSGALYSLCAQKLYLHFLHQNLPEAATLPDEQLLSYFQDTDTAEKLFVFTQSDGSAAPAADLLTSPVRGLLGILIVLCAMGAAMYHCKDLEAGTYAWLPLHLRPLAELGCGLTATVPLALAGTLSLMLSGLGENILWELAVAVLYGLCAAVFAMTLRRLVRSVKTMGALLPLLVAVMLVLCPVFFSLDLPGSLSLLLPPTYYIRGIHEGVFCLYMLLHTAAGAGVYLLLGRIFSEK